MFGKKENERFPMGFLCMGKRCRLFQKWDRRRFERSEGEGRFDREVWKKIRKTRESTEERKIRKRKSWCRERVKEK